MANELEQAWQRWSATVSRGPNPENGDAYDDGYRAGRMDVLLTIPVLGAVELGRLTIYLWPGADFASGRARSDFVWGYREGVKAGCHERYGRMDYATFTDATAETS